MGPDFGPRVAGSSRNAPYDFRSGRSLVLDMMMNSAPTRRLGPDERARIIARAGALAGPKRRRRR